MKVDTGETCTSKYVLKVKNCRENTESKEVLLVGYFQFKERNPKVLILMFPSFSRAKLCKSAKTVFFVIVNRLRSKFLKFKRLYWVLMI